MYGFTTFVIVVTSLPSFHSNLLPVTFLSLPTLTFFMIRLAFFLSLSSSVTFRWLADIRFRVHQGIFLTFLPKHVASQPQLAFSFRHSLPLRTTGEGF